MIVPAQFELTEQVNRILESEPFSGSEVLCKLLQYLTQRAVDQPGMPVKEFQLATEALGRAGDFDPRIDSNVRVLAARLRTKLMQYYATVGAEDSILIEIPKGSYVLHAERRSPNPVRSSLVLSPDASRIENGAALPQEPLLTDAKGSSLARFPKTGIVVLLCSLVIVSSAVVYMRHKIIAPPLQSASQISDLRQFWGVFLNSPSDPWVIFSNAKFVGKPSSGLRYYQPGVDPPGKEIDLYTGIGEVLATHNLDVLFSGFHRSLRVKREQLLTIDDAEKNNLIFLGAPVENPILNDLPRLQEFTFEAVENGDRAGDIAIRNKHPRLNESEIYLRSSNDPITDDYFVIALLKGYDSDHWILLLSGSGSLGTEAAGDFVCNEQMLHKLSIALGPGAFTRPFEVLLHTSVKQGVPVTSEIVAVRSRQ